jgi:hypothetical protein
MWYRVLLWPVVGLVITGAIHFTAEALWPDLHDSFTSAVVAPVLLAYGAWIGLLAIRAGSGYLAGIVAGAVLGVLPALLDIVGFGVLLGRGVDVGILAAAFSVSMMAIGTVLGAGFAMAESRRPAAS